MEIKEVNETEKSTNVSEFFAQIRAVATCLSKIGSGEQKYLTHMCILFENVEGIKTETN